MRMDLLSEMGEQLRISWGRWYTALLLAAQHGWKPAGTVTPARSGDKSFEGYLQITGQTILAEEAARIADALDLVLLDPEKQWPLEDHPLPEYVREMALGREALRTFVRFCRAGGFRLIGKGNGPIAMFPEAISGLDAGESRGGIHNVESARKCLARFRDFAGQAASSMDPKVVEWALLQLGQVVMESTGAQDYYVKPAKVDQTSGLSTLYEDLEFLSAILEEQTIAERCH